MDGAPVTAPLPEAVEEALLNYGQAERAAGWDARDAGTYPVDAEVVRERDEAGVALRTAIADAIASVPPDLAALLRDLDRASDSGDGWRESNAVDSLLVWTRANLKEQP